MFSLIVRLLVLFGILFGLFLFKICLANLKLVQSSYSYSNLLDLRTKTPKS